MPTKREDYNGYMRKFMLRRYHKRRRDALRRLGGCCAKCGSRRKLEFDHADPNKKSFGLWCRTVSSLRFEAELKKCQLLCGPCHRKKTCDDNGWVYSVGVHGTPGNARRCGPPKCKACALAWREYQREWRRGKYPKRNPRTVPEHGTDARYQRSCRCAPCKTAHSKTHKRWRLRTRSKL